MDDKRKRIRDRGVDKEGMHGMNFTSLMLLTVFDEKNTYNKK